MNLYHCHNHEPHGGEFGPIQVQAGWTEDGRRITRTHRTQWDPVECGHTPSPPDPRCGDCRWRAHERDTD